MGLYEQLNECLTHIKKHTEQEPEIGIILGSGLGAFAEKFPIVFQCPYDALPHFPVSTVPGHAGKLVLANVEGKSCAIMSGRVHCYEGHSAQTVSFGARLLALWGAQVIIITNAAGGINSSFKPGDIMVIRDHLNLLGDNPLTGANDDRFGTRFPDLSQAYTEELRTITKQIAKDINLTCHEGVYAAMSGPSYETPAEVEMVKRMGADAVGMSTVPEVIAAHHMGVRTLALSCITNLAAGVSKEPLSHDEVKEVADRIQKHFITLITKTIHQIPASS